MDIKEQAPSHTPTCSKPQKQIECPYTQETPETDERKKLQRTNH